MTEWKPIETAPLMEPIIVTWKNDKGDSVVYMACKNIISTRADTEHWETFNLDRIVSYWSSDMDGEDQLEVHPTHWMPLPALSQMEPTPGMVEAIKDRLHDDALGENERVSFGLRDALAAAVKGNNNG